MYCHKSASRGDKTGMDFHGVFMLKKKKQIKLRLTYMAGLCRGYGTGGGGRHRRLRSEAWAREKVRVSVVGQGSPVATGLPTWFSK